MKLLQLGTIFRPLEREGSKNVSKKGIVLIVKNFSLEVSKSKKKRIGIFNSSKKQPKHEKKLSSELMQFFFTSFIRLLVELRIPKIAFEIYLPLVQKFE